MLESDLAPSLDPDSVNAAAPELQQIHVSTFEVLLDYPLIDNGAGVLEADYGVPPDGTGYEPRLAESWSSVVNDDGTVTWTFNLRQGVVGCSGNTFTADDVIYTWERAKSITGGAFVTWFLGQVSAVFGLDVFGDPPVTELVGEVVKIDDFTVEITQLNGNDLFPRVQAITFQGIFDSKVMLENGTADDPWAHSYLDTENIASYGPYCLTKWDKGTEIILEANPNYYRGVPQFTDVTIRKVPQSANRVGAIITGDADIVTVLSPQEIASLREEEAVNVLGWDNNKVLFIGMSFNFEPWVLPSNEKLRQAVAYAMPYQEIIDADLGGDAIKMNGNLHSKYFGSVETIVYDTDPARAQELVNEFLADNSLDDLSGFSDGLEIAYTAERSNVLEPIANRIKTALDAVGIPVTLNPIPNAEFTDRTLNKYDVPMFLGDVDRPLAADAGYGSALFFITKGGENCIPRPDASCEGIGGLNVPAQYNNFDFDALHLEQSVAQGDARLSILESMQEKLMVDLPQVPIAEPTSFIAVKAGTVNCWAGQPFDLLNFWYFRTTDDCAAVAAEGNLG